MKSKVVAIVTLFFLFCTVGVYAQKNDAAQEYINKYKKFAIESMEKYGIPASITMAQACHESSFGRSRLAVEGNNHFGIKCKRSWTGMTIYHDDDEKDECFRKYKNAEESFLDHAKFLDESPRYATLFDLDPKDYVGWANGLKKAGYATNPKYPEVLVKLIEEYELYRLDEAGGDAYQYAHRSEKQQKPQTKQEIVTETPVDVVDVDNFMVNIGEGEEHPSVGNVGNLEVYFNNGVQYVIAGQGDTFESLAEKLRMSVRKLLKYNDLKTPVALRPGNAVYIKTKKRAAENGKYAHNFRAGETLHGLSQNYGIRLKSLCKMNGMTENYQPSAGHVIKLQ